MRKYLIVMPLFVLTGCFYNQTGIQGDYETVRKDCQYNAEQRIDQLSGARSEKDRNAELVTLFSDCMAKAGWQVATPRREITGTALSSSGTLIRKSRDDGSAIAGDEPPVPLNNPQQAPVEDGVVKTEATALTPGPGMPPLRQPVNPNASMYQPAPQQPVAPYYGSPGRSF